MIASFVFDLDSTVLRGELLPAIGEAVLGDRELGGKTMESVMGQVPFDRSFPARVERLRSVPVAQAAELARGFPGMRGCVRFSGVTGGSATWPRGNLDVWIAPWPGSWDWRAMCFPPWPRWRRGM